VADDAAMTRRFGAVAITAALLVTLGAPRAGAVKRTGSCSLGETNYTLTVVRYDATRLRVRFVVSNSAVGQSWQLFGSDDGLRIFAVARVASWTGVAKVTKLIPDRAGTDTVKATANNILTGEICQGSVSF
jgi:hypothetical protein